MTKQLVRVESGVPGLDTILCGGLVQGASYIVQGSPGAGKTILASQFAFRQVRGGGRVLYATLLAESHDRLFQTLSTFDFYDPSIVGKDIFYISLFKVLRDEGLPALVNALRAELGRQRCTTLILDGLLIAKDRAETALDVKTFVAELQSHAAFTGCTVLFLTSARTDDVSPEHTMVDGVLQLKEELVGIRTVRQIRVSKSRGSAAIGGFHQYRISNHGIDVYPRLEALHATPSRDVVVNARVASGVDGFEGIAGGGITAGSMSLLLGPAGSGKTTFGLNFLNQATPEAPALYFGFYESPERLRAKADALGIPLEPLERAGALHIDWHPLTENLLDSLGHQLLDAVRANGIRRLFVDGVTGFERAAIQPGRLIEFYAALSNELRAQGVTAVGTLETRDIPGVTGFHALPEYSSLMDNLVSLRHALINGELRRFLSIVKMRDSAFDNGLHEVQIGQGGLRVRNRLSITPDAFGGQQATFASGPQLPART
ncbi:ATPase domain-containing protein [Cupriavidus plantarum]|uniref:non-specific serine/threonine protein kinase n=1 Tax=Cupriavidus plantarum TaxID=942865 RepID=A0A316EYT4_9BURK|nr:ATPase domain-containing protein [Cupriavidus plantarum]NYH98532.1 circadian clock protein KaiC [Cupriavidus plantarum]PWK37814.1 circadian clock protein KaiC [Cupriavidus plantarum]RLK45673.1 circadian clock protein KaiC [Cupriavidus plantarum]CAG2127992.1 Circadian clock protein kinase KaiC [Cupriavidus plantarum]SMR66830.1 circadian clock protein KaiC [Cupriavidus plantarum]